MNLYDGHHFLVLESFDLKRLPKYLYWIYIIANYIILNCVHPAYNTPVLKLL